MTIRSSDSPWATSQLRTDDKGEPDMKRILVLLLVVSALVSCKEDDKVLYVPAAMRGTWIEQTSGQTITASSGNIVMHMYGGISLDFAQMIGSSPQSYDVSHTSSSVTITISDIRSSYHFSVDGGELTLRLTTAGIAHTPMTFHRQQ